MGASECFLCGSTQAEVCGKCSTVAYCTLHKEHHLHSDGCALYRVSTVEGEGRGLVAVKDIRKGELIFTCLPAAMGPTARTAVPQCISCFSLLPSPLHCTKCGLDVCGEKCARMEIHQAECGVLVLARAKLRRTDKSEKVWRAVLPSLQTAVTTLRLLSLQWRNPGEWAIVSNLMCDKLNAPVWKMIEEVYKKVLHLDPRIKEEELKKVFGIQCTNGANLHFLPGHGRGLGVYPVQAFLNHSCMCNTVTGEHPDEHRVELRARWDVKKGEQLTTSYIPPTQSTFARRHLLHNTWGFWCACSRCRDPTECGTYLGALQCSRTRCGGRLISPRPLEQEEPWQCDSCGEERPDGEAAGALQLAVMEIEAVKERPGGETTADLEELVASLSSLLHTSHFMMMELQQRLLAQYQRVPGTRVVKERMIQICHNLLEYMTRIDPDNQESRKRRSLEGILLQAKLDVLTQDYRAGLVSKERLGKVLAEKQAVMVLAQIQAKSRGMDTVKP